MVYPKGVTTPGDRLAYCYAALQSLMAAHNVVGAWRSSGSVSLEKLSSLPKRWQTALSEASVKEPLSEKAWEDFLQNEYRDAEAIIIEALCNAREEVKMDLAIRSTVDLDEALSEKAVGKDGD
jgi:hypothetical protein